ncbi:MAG: hypothetical protein M3069_32970 [Chloroflexota bacterium]|nr:hypothetical protein [Chloroflexota bacterium]
MPDALALGLIGVCLAVEAAVVRVGIDDLDEGYFVQQALRVLRAQIPYRDFETLYTPGLLALHALIFNALGGPYVLGPRVLALLTRAGLAIAVYALTRPLVRRPLWAAAPGLFLLLALDDAPDRWEPHPGWLSTLFAVLAAWCLGHRPTTRWLVGAGVAAALAYLFKQNTGVFILAAILAWGLWPHATAPRTYTARRPSRDQSRRVLVPLAAFVAVTLVWLVPLIFAVQYEVLLLASFVGAVSQVGLSSPAEPSLGIPVLCLAGGVWLARTSGVDPRLRWYLLAGVALLCTQYPRMDTLHLAWSAPLLLVVGAVALDRLRPPAASLAVLLGACVLTGPILPERLDVVRQPRVPLAELRFASDVEVPARTAADLQGVIGDIQRRTQPGEPIFVYPTSPLVYALADRPNPTRFDHLNPGAATPNQIQNVIADLETAHVRLIVISDYWRMAWGPPGSNAALEHWLDTRFAEVARYGAYRVLVAGL